ncbi:MAG: hypothetical protein AB7O52_12980 [Planctomycetota bacterium]
MGIFERLFGGSQKVDLEELRAAYQQVEKDRRRVRREVRRWERQRKKIVDRMKDGQRAGNKGEIDYLWDELKEHRKLGGDLRREARVYNLEGLALRRTMVALERLERRQDKSSARSLLDRIQRSGLAERLSIDRADEVAYLQEVNSILDDFAGEAEEEGDDPEKALFLAQLDRIARDEQAGELDKARELEVELLQEFDLDAEAE